MRLFGKAVAVHAILEPPPTRWLTMIVMITCVHVPGYCVHQVSLVLRVTEDTCATELTPDEGVMSDFDVLVGSPVLLVTTGCVTNKLAGAVLGGLVVEV